MWEKCEEGYSTKDVLIAFLCLGLGFLYCERILMNAQRIFLSGTLYALLFLGLILFVYRDAIDWQNKYQTGQIVLIVLFAINMILGANIVIRNVNAVLLLILCDNLVYSLATGKEKLGRYFYKDVFCAVVTIPARNALECIRAVFSIFRGNRAKNTKLVILGLALSVPTLLIVLPLLASADARMQKLVSMLMNCMSTSVLKNITRVIVTIFIGSRLFGLLYGSRLHVPVTESVYRKQAESKRKLPPISLATMMIPLCISYAIFFLCQLTYFCSAFSGTLPKGFSYAEYARKGFFELCFVAAINFGLILLVDKFGIARVESGSKLFRVMQVILCGMMEVLVATSISKMIMYICCFGFTRLRIYTMFFMVFLAFMFAFILIKRIRPCFRVTNKAVMTLCALVLVLSFLRIDARIAQWNIALYEAGVTESLDIDMLIHLSDEAIPYLDDFAQSGDDKSVYAIEALTQRVIEEEKEEYSDLVESRNCEFNVSCYRAQRHLRKYKLEVNSEG